MLFIKPGLAKTPIDIAEYMIYCPACETNQWADVMVLSDYWYYFYVPVFPTGKEANIICKNCGLKRYGAAFNEKLISNYEDVKRKYKHPWWTYLGIAIFILPILLAILFSALS